MWDALTAFAALAGVLGYFAAVRRYDRRHARARFSRLRALAFVAGTATALTALGSAIQADAARSFALHMAQHLLLLFVAAPLLAAGSVGLLLRQAGSPRFTRMVTTVLRSRPVEVLTHPLAAWGGLVVALWVTHLTGLYEAALEHPWIHSGEHLWYLAAGYLFWFPLLAAEPTRWRLGYPAKLLYVFGAVPANALLGVALYQSPHVLYAHYAALEGWGASALADQRAGAVWMWIGGGVLLLVPWLALAAAWARQDAAIGARLDARLHATARADHG